MVVTIQQTIGNMICTFCAHEAELDKDNPWTGMLGEFMFETRNKVHSTNRATPARLVFGRYTILSILHEADWD